MDAFHTVETERAKMGKLAKNLNEKDSIIKEDDKSKLTAPHDRHGLKRNKEHAKMGKLANKIGKK